MANHQGMLGRICRHLDLRAIWKNSLPQVTRKRSSGPLEETRPRANSLLKAYRLHQNVEQITAEIYGTYGDLMKFASYHLGNMAGLGITLDDLHKTKAALEGHSFAAHFVKLKELCESIATDYGNWTDRSKFETIGNLADEIVVEGGLIISDFRDDGGFYVHVRPPDETIPDLPE